MDVLELVPRLELSVKEALKGASFDHIDEMLLSLYYNYLCKIS
jgi:hypothetical protein